MATTPVYFWPYQSLTDPPNGADLGQALALAIEATVQANAAAAAAALAALDAAKPVARLRRTVAQSIPNNAFTDVQFDTEDFDTHSGHDNVTNKERYTAPMAGYYMIGFHAAFAASATGIRAVRLNKNGATPIQGSNNILAIASAGNGSHFGGMAIVSLALSDYVTMSVFQNSGGALDQEVSADSGPIMDVAFLRTL